jgi:hypothetical protein
MAARLIGLLAVAMALALPAAAAAGVELNERFTFEGATETCNGELVDVLVDIHVLSRVTYDATGRAPLGSTINLIFRGTGANGEEYVGPSHQTTQLKLDPDFDTAATHTETFNFELVRKGETGTHDDDLRTRAVFHFTIDANGELTSYNFDFSLLCN